MSEIPNPQLGLELEPQPGQVLELFWLTRNQEKALIEEIQHAGGIVRAWVHPFYAEGSRLFTNEENEAYQEYLKRIGAIYKDPIENPTFVFEAKSKIAETKKRLARDYPNQKFYIISTFEDEGLTNEFHGRSMLVDSDDLTFGEIEDIHQKMTDRLDDLGVRGIIFQGIYVALIYNNDGNSLHSYALMGFETDFKGKFMDPGCELGMYGCVFQTMRHFMGNHDITLSNATFPNTRKDFNHYFSDLPYKGYSHQEYRKRLMKANDNCDKK